MKNPVGKFKCTMAEYHAYPAVGSSGLRTILNQSPAHYWWDLNNQSPSTPAQALGTAIHEAILEPWKFEERAIVEPKFAGTGAHAARDKWHLENHGKLILKPDDFDKIQGILKSLLRNKTASRLISDGAAEESFFWTDPETKIQMKCRPDFLREGHIIVDVKSTTDASTDSFKKDVANYGYFIQAAVYLDGVTEVTGQKHDTFVILAVEKTAPFEIASYQLKPEDIAAGRAAYQRALKILKKCMDTGVYTGYPDAIQPIELPPWAYTSEE